MLTSEIDEVIVLQTVHCLQLATNVVLARGVVEVLDGRVLLIATEDLLGLESPVLISSQPASSNIYCCCWAFTGCPQRIWESLAANSLIGLVDVLDGQDGEVAVITEVPQSHPLAGRQAELVDLRLVQVEGDGHGEEKAVRQAVLLNNSVARIVLDRLPLLKLFVAIFELRASFFRVLIATQNFC